MVNPCALLLRRYLQWLISITGMVLMNKMMYTGSAALLMEGVFHAKSGLELGVNCGCDHRAWTLGSAQSVLHLYFLVLVELIGTHVSVTVSEGDFGQVLDLLLPKSLIEARVCFRKLCFLLLKIYVGVS